jgi:hypothetical protein
VGRLAVGTALAIVAALSSGCDVPSNGSVRNQSIADVSGSWNLISDGDFGSGEFGLWNVQSAPRVAITLDSDVYSTAAPSMRLLADQARIRSSVFVEQPSVLLPDVAPGSRYELTAQVRTFELNRRLPIQLKLAYTDGSYDFFPGGSGEYTPRGTTGEWTPIRIEAQAAKRLDYIDVFCPNTGPGELDGRLWVDDVSLRTVD